MNADTTWGNTFAKWAPEKWWWKYERAAARVWDFFHHDLYRGVRNLVLFFPVVWRWRSWDFAHDYDIFMRAIELHRNALLKFSRHEKWQRDVAGMGIVLRRWVMFSDQDGDHLKAFCEEHGDPLTWDRETTLKVIAYEHELWDLMHDHLKRHARGWWD